MPEPLSGQEKDRDGQRSALPTRAVDVEREGVVEEGREVREEVSAERSGQRGEQGGSDGLDFFVVVLVVLMTVARPRRK